MRRHMSSPTPQRLAAETARPNHGAAATAGALAPFGGPSPKEALSQPIREELSRKTGSAKGSGGVGLFWASGR